MSRLSARYKHFWATSKTYQHFWANSGNASVSGATLTVTSSIVAGLNHADAAINGQSLVGVVSLIAGAATGAATGAPATLTVNAALTLEGAPTTDGSASGSTSSVDVFLNAGAFQSIDATAPLNTRLNARYRHFWGRKRTERHFWAQWEGANIGESLADGDLIIATAAVIEPGTVTTDANVDGQTLTVNVTLDPAHIIIIEPGALTVIATMIGGGGPNADANVGGETLTVNAELIQGWARFDTITIPVTIIPGEPIVPPDAFAIPEPTSPVVVTLFAGVTANDSAVVGVDQTIDVSLLEGTVDVTEPGDETSVVVTLEEGTASGDANVLAATREVVIELDPGSTFSVDADANGDTVEVVVSIDAGSKVEDAAAEGAELIVNTTLVEGVATGEDTTQQPAGIRAGGPVGYQSKKRVVPINAQAHGTTFSTGIHFEVGKASVAPLVDLPKPQGYDEPPTVHIVGDVPDKKLPDSITQLLEPAPELVPVLAEPPAVHAEPVAVSTQSKPFDWIAYDNEALLEGVI